MIHVRHQIENAKNPVSITVKPLTTICKVKQSAIEATGKDVPAASSRAMRLYHGDKVLGYQSTIRSCKIAADTELHLKVAGVGGAGVRKKVMLKKARMLEHKQKLEECVAVRLPDSRDNTMARLELKATELYNAIHDKDAETSLCIFKDWMVSRVSYTNIKEMQKVMETRYGTTEARIMALVPLLFGEEYQHAKAVVDETTSKLTAAACVIEMIMTQVFYVESKNNFDMELMKKLINKIAQLKEVEFLVEQRVQTNRMAE